MFWKRDLKQKYVKKSQLLHSKDISLQGKIYPKLFQIVYRLVNKALTKISSYRYNREVTCK